MITFLDQNGHIVELSFSKHAFSEKANHVLVICQYGDCWVLTRHKVRGLEFPGGKCEPGETLEEAARREVYEETGAILDDLQFLAEYKVSGETGAFVKSVFWGRVNTIEQTKSYHETNGPDVVQGDLSRVRFDKEYSFIMKDQVIEECLKYINELICKQK
ncbi:nucleoside triphosphatase YtkD [Bacillus sp. BRMEA1]|uniref:RNA deprotection pyrophosphohydrolase n=1 Tax=Neobacillus endophyticus TaxID=2738405 RepID=UPI0015639A05|nr:nucleoside triphosphatase YtkD [Neobacillus endophyticus]NRD76232.1 nucleoside triphosphatase YtkD [Neobacillus endophyticus]